MLTMIKQIIGFQHDPELYIVNGIPTYITQGKSYRDKTLNNVTLDTLVLLDILSEPSVAKPPMEEEPQSYNHTSNTCVGLGLGLGCDDDAGVSNYPRCRSLAKTKAGGRRRYKKANTKTRIHGLDAKQAMSDAELSDDNTTHRIHSVKYLAQFDYDADAISDEYYRWVFESG